MSFWRWYSKTLFLVRTFVWISLLVYGTFWSFDEFFIISKMIDHAHSAIWEQKSMKQVPNSFVLHYFSKKILGLSLCFDRILWDFLFKITRKDCSFIFSLRNWWAQSMKLKRTIWKLGCTFRLAQFVFRKQKCSLGSSLIVEKEKLRKNLRQFSRNSKF